MEYNKLTGYQSRSATFENPDGTKGRGGIKNSGAKGSHMSKLMAGETKTLLDIKGSGCINRIFITLSDRAPAVLNAIKIEMFWDDSEKSAVSAPLCDFFGAIHGLMVPFESAYLSNPEGRSFISHFNMPFISSARVVLTNESDKDAGWLAYDISFGLYPLNRDEILYFHCYRNRENTTALTRDYTVLPKISGEGRFLGAAIGVNTNTAYGDTWFGEGEIKIYLDGDKCYPTICGTGTEDYVGTAWGMGAFSNMTQGCPIADKDNGHFVFYRFHKDDIVYFNQDIRVEIQNIGGAMKKDVLALVKQNVPLKITTCDPFGDTGELEFLFDTDFVLTDESKDGWYNFYRMDDFASVAYFYFAWPCV